MDPKHCIPLAVYYNISSNGISTKSRLAIWAVNTETGLEDLVNTWNWSGRSSVLDIIFALCR